MASLSKTLSSFSILVVILTITTQTHLSFSLRDAAFNPKDIHELLSEYGLPKGLLPNNVNSYTLSDDGTFEIELLSDCYVRFGILMHYNKNIKGKLSYGSLANVSGILTRVFSIWFSVTEIEANEGSGTIQFYTGPLARTFPAREFQDIRSCRNNASLIQQTTQPIT